MDGVIEQWSEFNVAMAGATAALAGLVIVASSVNIGEIVKSRTLTARLGAGISALVLAIAATAIALVPGISAAWYGALIIFATLVSSVFQINATRLIATDPDPADRGRFFKYLVGFLPLAAFLTGGVLTVAGQQSGLYFTAAGSVLAIVAAIIVSWVALVEVLR